MSDFSSVVTEPISENTKYQHFIRTSANELYVGNHLILDLYGVRTHRCQNEMVEMFREAATAAGATVLYDYVHEFGPECGTTGVIVLSESHISWHEYPETGMIVIDAFMCGKALPEKIIPFVEEFFNPSKVIVNNFRRGVVNE